MIVRRWPATDGLDIDPDRRRLEDKYRRDSPSPGGIEHGITTDRITHSLGMA